MSGLESLLQTRRIAICVGSGGVGKTTVATSLALRAAAKGQKVLVVTIDPARRLANSLGLKELGNYESRIDPGRLADLGLHLEGELWAMMLDVKRTSDDLVARYASSRKQAERIYQNKFYQTASTVLAGSHEYLAMEKLYALHSEGVFDLVVLDTPPTRHALDFLNAPNRVLDLFHNDALRWIATPAVAAGMAGARALGFGGGYFVRQISKFTGMETLSALAEFIMSMQGMYGGFKERAAKVKELLASSETAFVLVTAPGAMNEAHYFHTVLQENEMPLGAVVINRVHPDWRKAGGGELDADLLAERFEPSLATRLAETVSEQQIRAEADHGDAGSLAESLSRDIILRLVPVFERDLHDISGLAHLARCLFDGDGDPAMAALPLMEPDPCSSCGKHPNRHGLSHLEAKTHG